MSTKKHKKILSHHNNIMYNKTIIHKKYSIIEE